MFSGLNNFSYFCRGSPKEHFCEIILKSGHWSRRRYHLKVFLFLALAAIFLSAERKHFSNFDRRPLKKHFCEIISKSAHWSRRRWHLNVVFFYIFSSGGHFVQGAKRFKQFW